MTHRNRRRLLVTLACLLFVAAIMLAAVVFVTLEFERVYPSPGRNVWMFTMPLWAPMLASGILGVLLWRRARRRTPDGFCPVCSYDLTGNVSGTCPECGTAVSSETG